ncbi:unnamed protein product [Linum trigynum]|uniref:Aminotransferase-like plant mobile domain-containing protein n=1 Tax=Linum trigynum TaxID=586398 RepID=A0AAV2GC25_9ROSI
MNIVQRHKLRNLRDRNIAEHFHLDWEVFEELHARPQMMAAVRSQAWRRLLTLAEPTYKELVWDFYATFHHNSKGNSDHADAVQFTLGGVEHSLSYWEFANALRLNSRATGGPPLRLDLSDPTDFACQAYFQSICLPDSVDEEYVASQTRAALLRPEWRILNHPMCTSYTPSQGSSNRVTLRTLWLLHAMGRSEDTIQLGSVLARTFTKAAISTTRSLVCGPVITALARNYGVDYTGMTLVRGATPLGEPTLRHQHLVARLGLVRWIAGLPQPLIPAEGDQAESSAAGGCRVPRRVPRRAQAPASPSPAPRSPSPGSPPPVVVPISDQLVAIALQNERIMAGQERIHTCLDRERDRGRCLMSRQHYIMSYLGLDPNAVHYPFVQSPGFEDEYPPPTGDGGDAF